MTILYRRICTTSYQKKNQKNHTKNQKVNEIVKHILYNTAWIYNKRDMCIPKMLQRVADRTLC